MIKQLDTVCKMQKDYFLLCLYSCCYDLYCNTYYITFLFFCVFSLLLCIVIKQ